MFTVLSFESFFRSYSARHPQARKHDKVVHEDYRASVTSTALQNFVGLMFESRVPTEQLHHGQLHPALEIARGGVWYGLLPTHTELGLGVTWDVRAFHLILTDNNILPKPEDPHPNGLAPQIEMGRARPWPLAIDTIGPRLTEDGEWDTSRLDALAKRARLLIAQR